ncbi:MAG TPA: APC family permease [Acidobacteriaceae bacterium]|jgi:amino acid transporter
MRLLPLIAATFFMVSGGPYGIEDILGGAGYTWAFVLLLGLPLLWSLPTALMIGELASALPAEGGFYVWVRRALGPFWGFQEAWLSLAASIFDMAIYPTLFTLYLGRLAPSLTAGHRAIWWALAVLAACLLWNLLGAASVGSGSVWLMCLLMAPFAVLVTAGMRHGISSPAHSAGHTLDFATAFLVALWNYMGWDNASTVAAEVERPQRNYPRAMIAAAALVTLCYFVPTLAARVAGLPAATFSTGSWADAARMLVGPWLGLAIVAGGMINGFGMCNALMLSYTRLPVALAQDGFLPRMLALHNRFGAPWVAILLCAVGWALAVNLTFERLISIDLVLYGGSLILEFVALAVLRWREPQLDRPFRIPGGTTACVLIGIPPTILIAIALVMARGEQIANLPALGLASAIALLGPVAYAIQAPWSRNRQTALTSSRETTG